MGLKKMTGSFALVLISIIVIFSTAPGIAYSEKITIAYTGNSYSSLYPCGGCPASVGGGVTRRAAAIDELKDKENTIIIDGGNFTAGGVYDTKSISPDKDKKRTLFNYQAMQAMGYEVTGVGENEFVFGSDFLKNNTQAFKFKFVSSNIKLDGVVPYYIKEVAGIKVGILGLSPKSIYKKLGIEVGDYEKAIRNVLGEIKEQYDILVLVSAVGDYENRIIAKKFPQINVIISSGPVMGAAAYESIGDVLLLRPSYEAKALRMVELEVNGANIAGFDFKEKKLSLDLKESTRIKKMVPACFSDKDCRTREGLVNKCQEPGGLSSSCAYYAAEKIDAVIVTDKNCSVCSTELTEQVLKDKFLGITFRKLNYRDAEAKALIKRYQVGTLPLFVIDQKIENEKNFNLLSEVFQKHDDKYTLSKDLSGLFMFLEREQVPNRIDLFLDFYETGSKNIFDKLVQLSKEDKVEFKTHFVITKSKTAAYPQEEVKVALAVRKIYPKKIEEYVSLRLQQISQGSWVTTLDELGLDYKKVQSILKSDQTDKLLETNRKLIDEVGVKEGNVILITNNRIFKAFDIDAKLLEKMF